MPFRTPRRRISPRTKQRVRAIKEFFKKTLGTSSQTDYQTNSSLILSVTDLKSKVDIIEQQLDKVSKHCHDLSCLEASIKRGESSIPQHINNDGNSNVTDIEHTPSLRAVETEVLYKTPKNQYSKTDESVNTRKYTSVDSKNTSSRQILNDFHYHTDDRKARKHKISRSEKRQRTDDLCNENLDKHRMHNVHSNTNTNFFNHRDHRNIPSSSNYHRNDRRDVSERDRRDHRNDRRDVSEHIERSHYERNEYRQKAKGEAHADIQDSNGHHKNRKNKHKFTDLDEEFIADIIRRQYKPVKLFGRRLSDFSQFSAPVCRDQEFSPRTRIEEGSELCSCCYEGQGRVSHRYCVKHDVSDMRSICDARLYSSKRHRRYKQAYYNDYNDSSVYDIVPVKEKASPKSRRKFIKETTIPYECYKEVPPSPRTHKPRLNLKAQHCDYEDSLAPKSRHISKCGREPEVYDNISEVSVKSINRCIMDPPRSQNLLDQNLRLPLACNDQTKLTNNNTSTAPATSSSINKTDQALHEIKDILQTFLQEIKKESSSDHSQKDHKPSELPDSHEDPKNTSTQMSFGGQNFNTSSNMGQCGVPPFIPPFTNPCCYPILPICPMSCSPNGYVVPSPSFTCTNCATNSKQTSHLNNKSPSNYSQAFDETQELIKEIYKAVAQSPKNITSKNVNVLQKSNVGNKILTSRSVGSSNASKRDVMVETPKMKCYSKSCEAIGSRLTTNTCYSATNPSYSDTVLEKLSLEVTESSSDTETELAEKVKKHKFSKMFRKIGLFKRKKKDFIEEVSESESTIEVEVHPKSKPPFRQRIMDYSVHGQEYLHPPPVPDPERCYANNITRKYACGDKGFESRPSPHETCMQRLYDPSTPVCYRAPPKTPPVCCAHDYNPYCYNIPPHPSPQVPLCLKEIEVKSTGTQSERKMSIFRKFRKNVQSPPFRLQQASPKTQYNYSTQTAKQKSPMFNWKSLQEKARQANSSSDPMKFSLKTQKQLAEGDMKMRNAMMKKLFYKRNPFSPRNLIVRTLLGKDKSSFGDPPKMYRPRMFL